MSPADRPPLTRRRVLAGGAVATVAWSNPTVTALGQVGSCVPSGGEPEQQLAIPGNGTVLDTWRSNLMINESRFYTNTSGAPQTIHPTSAAFESGRTGIPFTPFFVQILGDNNFIVLAVGTTRISANLGTNTNAFSDNPGCFTLPDGGRLGIGFLDSNADGVGPSTPRFVGRTVATRSGTPVGRRSARRRRSWRVAHPHQATGCSPTCAGSTTSTIGTSSSDRSSLRSGNPNQGASERVATSDRWSDPPPSPSS